MWVAVVSQSRVMSVSALTSSDDPRLPRRLSSVVTTARWNDRDASDIWLAATSGSASKNGPEDFLRAVPGARESRPMLPPRAALLAQRAWQSSGAPEARDRILAKERGFRNPRSG